MHQISKAAEDLIIQEEVTSKAYYERHYTRPEWPGGASGITIGIGYDLGYATEAKVKADWDYLVSPEILAAMVRCCGVKGQNAKALLAEIRGSIVIGWTQAMQVFEHRDLPQWTAATYHALPNCDLLSPTCLGVLVSLNYNRGVGGYDMSGDRYTEMRGIKLAMRNKNFAAVPALLDSMARLWPGSGVAGRRHREAELFRQGLKEDAPAGSQATPDAPDPSVIASSRPDQPARTKPPATTAAQHGTAGAIVATTTVVAAHAGLTPTQIILAILASVVVAGGIWFAWYQNRNPS